MSNYDAGKVAYDAYYEYAHGKSLVTGKSLQPWEYRHEGIKDAWAVAAQAVREAYRP